MNVARLRSPVYALCLSILAVAAACGTADVPPNTKVTNNGAGGTASTTGSGGSSSTAGAAGSSSTVGAGGGAGTATGTGGAGGTDVTTGVGGAGGSGPPPVMGPITPLPVVVDSSYAASGYMGDGMMAGSIVADVTCPARGPGNIGKCSKFTYTPVAMSTYGWGGVYWQYPANNWGTMQGERIAPGATKVTFYAAGAKGGEKVNFFVGGLATATGAVYQDPVKVSLDAQVLTTTMTAYTINLTGFTYDAIIGGFGWSIEAPAGADAGAYDPTPIVFYVDGIQWVM
jgi:hypothetical protein